jgi:FkbM family methyltransferase
MNLVSRICRKYESLRWDMKNWLHGSLLVRLDLERTLDSGIHIKISNLADWTVYNDIFVEAEYDAAIRAALNVRGNNACFRVIDLGANVGFFAMRLYYFLAHTPNPPNEIRLTCVEGSPTIYRELTHRIDSSPALRGKVSFVHGLAGRLDGSAVLVDSSFHPMSSLHSHRQTKGTRVRFVDLNQLFPDESVHLIKCDIEGSEWDFINCYPDLLQRTHVAVFELHHDKCDRSMIQSRLHKLGFGRPIVIKEDRYNSLELFENTTLSPAQ